MNKENQPTTKKCPACGWKIPVDAVECECCGEWFDKQAARPIRDVAHAVEGQPLLAGRWRRLGAFLMDGPVVWLLGFAGGFSGASFIDWASIDVAVNLGPRAGGLLGALVGFAYFTLCHGVWGATVGKWAMGIRVVRSNGRPPGWWALVRTLVMFLLSAVFITWWPVLGQSRRAIHDYAAGTYVVRGRAQIRPMKAFLLASAGLLCWLILALTGYLFMERTRMDATPAPARWHENRAITVVAGAQGSPAARYEVSWKAKAVRSDKGARVCWTVVYEARDPAKWEVCEEDLIVVPLTDLARRIQYFGR